MFAIKKGSLYVSKPGSESSYTFKMENAQLYHTYGEADRNRCPENERVVIVSLGTEKEISREEANKLGL